MEYNEKSVEKVSLMECHEELVNAVVDTLMEYHEKSELGRNRHTSGVLLGISLDLWSICIHRMRPTVDVNLSSGHCESVRTRLVLISCVSDHARCMAQVQVFDPCLVTFVLFAPRVIHMSSVSA